MAARGMISSLTVAAVVSFSDWRARTQQEVVHPRHSRSTPSQPENGGQHRSVLESRPAQDREQ